MEKHIAGFVNIIGQPNVGKSTLMNALVGERMSIITNKPQTTRHRIIGIVSGDDYQVVFSDTPGHIKNPAYKMQEKMNKAIHGALDDADLLLFVIDIMDQENFDEALLERLKTVETPIFLVLNKCDAATPEQIEEAKTRWQSQLPFAETHVISALEKQQTEALFASLRLRLPEHPAYYPKDQLTDRPERFFVSEIVREKILLNYYQEIPYSCEVVVASFKEDPEKDLVRISCHIYVARDGQKNILIGKGGSAIKQLGIDARVDIEKFLEQKVFLELVVKVRENWRDDDLSLRRFGYEQQ